MNLCDDPVNPCTSLGHVYSAVTVVRCRHVERWDVTARTWVDNDSDEPTVLFEAGVSFGPFDDIGYIVRRTAELATLAIDHQRDHQTL